MLIDRRQFLELGVFASFFFSPSTAWTSPKGRIKAVAFDAFAVFDPRPIFALAETLFPTKGAALSEVWRTRQFEYQWLRALSGRHEDVRGQ